MMKKRKEVKKKIKKLTKEEYHIKFLKDNLENRKRVYEVYIKAIVKYNIKNVAYSSIMSDELYHNELMKKMRTVRNDPKGFHRLMFGEPKKTEEERIEGSIKYFDKLIEYAKWKVSNFSDEIKTKMAKDSVEKGHGWLALSSENYDRSKKSSSPGRSGK